MSIYGEEEEERGPLRIRFYERKRGEPSDERLRREGGNIKRRWKKYQGAGAEEIGFQGRRISLTLQVASMLLRTWTGTYLFVFYCLLLLFHFCGCSTFFTIEISIFSDLFVAVSLPKYLFFICFLWI